MDTAESKREPVRQETFAPQAQLEEEEDDELCQSTLTPQKYECVMHPSDVPSENAERRNSTNLNVSRNRYSQVSQSSASRESCQDLEVSLPFIPRSRK